MGLIDIIILIVAILGLILGYMKGFVGQLSTICGIVLGIIVCNMFGDWATSILVEIVPESAGWPMPEYTTSAIANIVLFLIVFLSIKLVGMMFKSVLKTLHLNLLDRLYESEGAEYDADVLLLSEGARPEALAAAARALADSGKSVLVARSEGGRRCRRRARLNAEGGLEYLD